MYLKSQSSYISGLMNLASSISKTISKSYIQADCFEKKNYQKSFTTMYEIPEDVFHLKEYNKDLEKLLRELLGNNKDLIEGLLHWLSLEIGTVKKIYTVDDNKALSFIGGETGGYGPFYFCEDVYFIETDRLVLCLLIGNDE